MRSRTHHRLTWSLLWLVAATAPVAAQSAEDTARAVHLLRRATWGVRPADVSAVLSVGREKWLEQQLNPSTIADAATDARLQRTPVVFASMAELYRDFSPLPD